MTQHLSFGPLCRFTLLGLTLSSPGAGAFPVTPTQTTEEWLTTGTAQAAQNRETNPFALTAIALPHLLAHAILVKANPEKESVISDAPEEVLLIFNDGVGEEYLALAVVDEAGKRVDKHDAKLDFTDRSHLRATVEKLPPGRYMVRYRVLSADGHVVSGKYYFQVQGKQ
ncbi:copper resistance CopC family protein [Methyloterricola oryzae]|uniref:copper resistance CopC family protein n=1 Tax=Methyloterricola oryzae TaxID=1495050 RepID=UPI0009E4938D|nr:copper resistance CopC family protein [Methyloterricola oryzae]